MTRKIVFVATLFGLCACAPPPAPPPPPPVRPEPPPSPKFEQVVDDALAAWFELNPVTATARGEHKHDAVWPDLSPDGVAADRNRIDAAIASLDDLAATELNTDEDLDLQILRSALQAQLFAHEVERPWVRDPLWYAQLIGAGLEELVSREYAPVAERAASVASRLETLPALIEVAKTNLTPGEVMTPHAKVALDQLEGTVVLITETVPQRLVEAPQEVLASIEDATPDAVDAIRSLQKRLRRKIIPAARGQWRLGAENFERKLQLTLQADASAKQLRRRAVFEHGRVRKRMAAIAHELADTLFTRRGAARLKARFRGNVDAMITREVLGALAANHVAPDALRDAVESTLGVIAQFVKQERLVSLDEQEVLEVIWTPPHQRGVYVAGLAPPGPLDADKRGLPSFYLVQPIPQAWDEERTESHLREYNNFMLEILSVHEAIPGHFVQLYYSKRHPSKVRRALENGAFVEGWAVYMERVIVEAGYAGAGPAPDAPRPDNIPKGLWQVMVTPELRAKAIALHRLKFYLRTVTNAILDNSIHAGRMTREQALELMVQRSFQEPAEAKGKWTRAQVTSTQLSTYFVGAQAWQRLRGQAEARAQASGEAFDVAAFHDAALAHGAPPVPMMPRLLAWDDATVSAP